MSDHPLEQVYFAKELSMSRKWNHVTDLIVGLLLVAFGLALPPSVTAQGNGNSSNPVPRLEIYGFVMTDMGYSAGQNDPAWFNVIRPTKLPAFENQFGEDGRTYFGVRQTRFGAKVGAADYLG